MKKKEINLIRSETWLTADFDDINSILENTIKEFVEDERIINIQVVTEKSGLSRFWIYIESITV